MRAGLFVRGPLPGGVQVEAVEAFGAELTEIFRGLVGAVGVGGELLLQLPPPVLAAGALQRPLELAEFTLVRVGRHSSPPERK